MPIIQSKDENNNICLKVYPSCVICGNIAEYISEKGLYYCVIHTRKGTDIK